MSAKIYNDPKAIAKYGWQFYEKCKCQRTLKYIYRHPDKPGLFLEWWVMVHQFRVMDGNMTKTPLASTADFDKVLSIL